MSETHQRRLNDPYVRKKVESCLALSPSRKGNFSAEHRERLSKALTGRKLSFQHAAKARMARVGKLHSEVTKLKIAEAHRGKPNPGAHRKQSNVERTMRSETQKRRYLRPGERERQASSIQKRWNESGNSHRPETIEKMKEARSRQAFPLVDTKPEQTVQKILTVLGIMFESHRAVVGLGRHQWDIVLRENRLLIEVDGCYWHGCDRCCPHSEIGKQNYKRDRILDTKALADGWQVLRIWEHDIVNGEAVLLIQNQVSKQGIFESVS